MMAKFKFAWGLFAVTVLAGLVAFFLTDPNAQIPVHWNANGDVDDWAGPAFAFFLIPGIQLVMILIFSALPVLEPRAENIGKSHKAVHAIVFGTVGVMAVAQTAIIAAAYGYEPLGPKTIIAAVGIMIAVVGNYMSKLKSNFFIGIRTPWTLSSETVWKKTHRLGAKLFILSGTLVFASAFLLPAPYLATVVLGVVLPVSLYIVIYSWYLWRQEKAGQL